MKINIMQDLVVSVFGLAASWATAGILYLCEEHFALSLYSLMMWFVVPIGAIISGFVASGGYYFGSILFGYKPTKLLMFNIVFISVSTFFMIYWLGYTSVAVNGRPIKEFITFSKYIDEVITHQSMNIHVHGSNFGSTGELGGFGYFIAILQILGFAIGGLIIYGILSSLPYCQKCSKYLKARSKQDRYAPEAESFKSMITELGALFNADQLQKALDIHGTYGEKKMPKGGYLMSTLERKQCPVCKMNWLQFSPKKLERNGWNDITELQFAKYYDGELQP